MNARDALGSPVGKELTSTLVQVGMQYFVSWLRSRHADPDGLTAEEIAAEAKAMLAANAETAEQIHDRIEREEFSPTEG
jgi:hypothetical protein